VLPNDACPECGTPMREKRGKLKLPVNGQDMSVPEATHLSCPKCHEVVLRFDDGSMTSDGIGGIGALPRTGTFSDDRMFPRARPARAWNVTRSVRSASSSYTDCLFSAVSAIATKPVFQPYEHMAVWGRSVIAFLSGESPLRMGREEGSEEPEEAWGLIREGAVRLRGPYNNRVIAEDLSHSSSEKRYYCFGLVEGGVMTVRFTYRDDVIRIFGAGYWRKGKQTYEREHQVHGRTSRKAEGRS